MLAWFRTHQMVGWAAGLAAAVVASAGLVAVVETTNGTQWATRIGLFGTVATVIGLLVALRQLFQTRTAAEASSRAATEAERRTAATLAFSLVDHLPQIEHEINSSLPNGREAVRRLVFQWRQMTGEVQRILHGLDGFERTFAERLHTSVALATASERALSDPTLPAAVAVTGFRAIAGRICSDIPELKARLARTTGGPHA